MGALEPEWPNHLRAAVSTECSRLLTVKEVAARLRTSTATVYGLCERGELAHVRISTHAVRISEADLAELVRCGAVRRT